MPYYRPLISTIDCYRSRLTNMHYLVLVMFASLVGTVDCGSVYQEMADRLNVELGTVKSRLNRARKALQKLVDAGRAPSEA